MHPFTPSSPDGETVAAPPPSPRPPAAPEEGGETGLKLEMPPSVPPEYLPPPFPMGPAPKTPKTSRTVRNVIVFLILGSTAVGFAARTLRQARAAPQDKAACLTVLDALAASGSGGTSEAMFNALNSAKDKTLQQSTVSLANDLQQQDMPAFTTDLNKVIGRCRSISSDFRDRFHDFCQTHEGACTKSVDINPF